MSRPHSPCTRGSHSASSRFCAKLAVGRSVSEIAQELFISVKTVSTYRARFREMNLDNQRRPDGVRAAQRPGPVAVPWGDTDTLQGGHRQRQHAGCLGFAPCGGTPSAPWLTLDCCCRLDYAE